MTLPHDTMEDEVIEPNNRLIEVIENFRSSNAVIQLAHAINITLTFIFGFRFMPEVFNIFGEASDETQTFSGGLAGLALIGLFDLPYHAWNNIARRPGLSTEQMATANTAAKASLRGSLAASIAAIVLSQNLIVMPQSIVYGATGIGLVAVAYIAIMHMKWWDDFNKQGFDAKQRAEKASQQAIELSQQIKRQKELAHLANQEVAQRHELEVAKIKHEQQLEMARIKAEQEMRQAILTQKLDHKKEVANQVSAKVKAKIGQISSKIADKEAEELTNQFLAEYGVPTDAANGSSSNGASNDPKLN